jgi:hypothetical protein
MGKEFEIVFEGDFPGTPEEVWNAVNFETPAWLFPTDAMGGVDLVSERPTHHVNRIDGPDGWFNQLEQVISPRAGGGSTMRWVHSGVFTDDWDTQYDGASKHTAFYLHTLGQYLEFFAPRPAVFAEVQAPEASRAAGSFELVRSALGIRTDTLPGESTNTPIPGATGGAVVDLQDGLFIGLRTDDALYRFFGRNAFGAPVGMTVHHFGGADPAVLQREWQAWINALFAAVPAAPERA